MGQTVNIKRTEMTSVGDMMDFCTEEHRLKRVEHFQYLCSFVIQDCRNDEKIKAHIQAASCSFGRLRDRVFDISNRLHWMSHIAHMPDVRPTLFYGKLVEGSKKVGHPFLKFKDTLKDMLYCGGAINTWRDAVVDRPA